MGAENHLDITAMTNAAGSPDLNCKLVEEAFRHLAELPPSRQLSILKEIEHKNAASVSPGEKSVRLYAHEFPDEVSGGRTVTLFRSDQGGYNDQSVFTGIFVGHKLTELRICGQPQILPTPKTESTAKNAPHHGK